MPATIHFVRLAQGYHNLPRQPGGSSPYLLPDPNLTALGRAQCAELRRTFPLHDRITHLVASPLRRALRTCLLSFVPAVDRLGRVTALPEVQEVSSLPCDTGSAPAALVCEFGGDRDRSRVDLALVEEGWNDKSPDSPFASELGSLVARARKARVWLRELATGVEGADPHIVVVTHGGVVHFLTDDWDGMNMEAGTGWKNTEWRSYEFVDASGQDPEASLRETAQSWERRRGDAVPLTADEQRVLRTALWKKMQSGLSLLESERKAGWQGL